jgi:hypothetical protein
MSLWVSLYQTVSKHCGCPECKGHQRNEVFDQNITHNLGNMADEAGIYEAIWRPEEIGAVKAADIIEILTVGLAKMKAEPQRFEQFNASNGWGTYEDFVPWIERYLNACIEYPNTDIEVSR